jgi:hypothetical protein
LRHFRYAAPFDIPPYDASHREQRWSSEQAAAEAAVIARDRKNDAA